MSDKLQEEINSHLENMQIIVQELASLRKDVEGREPTNREKMAAAGYLAQFYNGVENILKRMSRFYHVSLPSTDTWHIDLFSRFCEPSQEPLPCLFDAALASDLTGFRKFRHVFYHGYGFLLDWQRMKEGIDKSEDILERFKLSIACNWKENP